MPVRGIGSCLLLVASALAIHGCAFSGEQVQTPWVNGRLVISENGRFLRHENGKPFFWQADTAWRLFHRLNRSDVETYLENRRQKQFNVVQVAILFEWPEVNAYGDTPFADGETGHPKITPGDNPQVESEYDYWDHVDFVVDKAAEKGIYLAMVSAWGDIVKEDHFTLATVRSYGRWLAERYGDKPNIV